MSWNASPGGNGSSYVSLDYPRDYRVPSRTVGKSAGGCCACCLRGGRDPAWW